MYYITVVQPVTDEVLKQLLNPIVYLWFSHPANQAPYSTLQHMECVNPIGEQFKNL